MQKPAFTPTSFYKTCFNYTNSLFHKLPSTPTSSYVHKRTSLHIPASTQTGFPTPKPLHKPPFAPANFYKPSFTQISLYANQLLRKPTFRQPPFTQTSFHINQLLRSSSYTHHFFDKLTFYTNQLYTPPALGLFGPVGRRPADCRRL